MGETATGRPSQTLPVWLRLVVVASLMLAALEGGIYLLSATELGASGVGGALKQLLFPVLTRYWPVRSWVQSHALTSGLLLGATLTVLVVLYRYQLLFWSNVVLPYFTGTRLLSETHGFKMHRVNLLEEIRRRPPGHAFVGMTPSPSFWGTRWSPVYVSQRQKSMHRHVIGKTGSGKTASVLWPSVLQDALDGKGILVMSAKGSDEEVRMMKAIAGLTARPKLKVFCLPAWNQPTLFSHTYNMVYVRPTTPTDTGGDPAATAERVFSVLPMGDNEYYNVQAQIMFTNLVRLLHGIQDEQGYGIPFVLRDVAVCLKGIGNTGGWERALQHCLQTSKDTEAARSIEGQVKQLGNDVNKCFSGVVGAIDKFMSPLVNAYAPDIIIEDILQHDGMLYVQLPANLFKIQAPALGKVFLMDVQQEGSLRQVFRTTRNQNPFSVTVDKFYNFADISVVDSLNKLRDARLEYTLAHQSIADLELVSKEFATAVWDNTRAKDILNQDNPELCEKVSKSIGTHQVIEKTVRAQQGALMTSLMTGDASTKLVEAYKLHPNAIKSLERCGQGYFMSDEGIKPIAYGMMPDIEAELELPQNDQSTARGLKLYETFIEPGRGAAGAAA